MRSDAFSKKDFPCPGCGARLEFNPTRGQLECLYCGRETGIPLESTPVVAQLYEASPGQDPINQVALSTTVVEVECPGCKAQVTFEPPMVAGKCPFCSTSIVVEPHAASSSTTPVAILPFLVEKRAAAATIQQWLHGRWFAPKGLHQLSQQEGMQGIYLPFWIYDCETFSHYRGERGKHYTTTETYTETNAEGQTESKTREVQETRWTSVSGEVSRRFDDVLVAGTQSVDHEYLDKISDWDLSKLKNYDASYLAGFKAQRTQIDSHRGLESAKQIMEREIRSAVECDIGGDDQRVNSISTNYRDITFKQVLLPVWMTTYHFKNKRYSVIVNAQTGQVAGDRPFSTSKILTAVVSALAAIASIFGIKTYLENLKPLPSMRLPEINFPHSPKPTVPK
jgi:ribosomal protein S27E